MGTKSRLDMSNRNLLMEHCERILDDYRKLEYDMHQLNNEYAGELRLGAYNRRYFEDEIKNKTNTAGVAVIDMDYLKVYNDTYGHRAGDHALEMMVNVIRQNIRKTDSLIRYGGDEFLLILPEISKESFNEKLKKIRLSDIPA